LKLKQFNTMILITYDLKSDHNRVKKALKAKGWKEQITGENGVVCNLPNTSLWRDGTDTAAAREEVRSVVSEPTLERLICVNFSGWAGISGETFAA
jgi:hypothetical protein